MEPDGRREDHGAAPHRYQDHIAILSVTDETLAAQPFIDSPDAAENALTGLLRAAQEAGLADADADARTEAIGLLAMAATLGTSILVGQRGPEAAVAVLRYHLDRIFTAQGPSQVAARA